MTPHMIKRMIVQEARRLRKEVLETGKEDVEKAAKDTEEVDADEYADSIEQDVDWMKALKIHETRLVRKIREVRSFKKRIARRLTKKL
jgi:hypothetical protein